ncbi:MAG: response regulator transcription factor [Patescibacteria group bacterium]
MGRKNSTKVLIIEDDNFLLSMYATKFEKENFEVFSAEDGEKGLRKAIENSPDIILLDIILPKMDGFEVLKKLKSQKKTKNIPVLLLTNLSQQDDSKKGLSLGADDYLIKAHFMPSEVVEKVKKYL